MEDLGFQEDNYFSVFASPFKIILLSSLGFTFWGIEHIKSGFRLYGSKSRVVKFSELFGPAGIKTSLGITRIVVPLKDEKELRIVGISRKDAEMFVYTSKVFFCHYVQIAYGPVENEVNRLAKYIDHLVQPSCYPAACSVSPFLKRAAKIFETLPINIPKEALSDKKMDSLTKVVAFMMSFHQIRNTAITTFLEKELDDMADFFDTIESYPLTTEQRRAVVTDEDATLVLAGAGSGKTSVIVSKAAYLAKKNICDEEEILLIAFGRAAAEEMTRRIKQKSGIAVEALTFHALGNKIIREVEGCTPPLAVHANDRAKRTILLRDILINDLSKQERLEEILLEWFSELFYPDKNEWDFENEKDYRDWVKKVELRTLNGDMVKSYEELLISNWLYRNGIKHEYEPVYSHPLPKDARSNYKPDFCLTEIGIYIEHFGVRKMKTDGQEVLVTAPHIDTEKYLEEMAWKRQIHRNNDTILIETFSYEREEGRLVDNLQKKLAQYNIDPDPIPKDQIFQKLSRMGMTDSFSRTLGDFLCLFKNSNSSIDQCYSKMIRNEREIRRSRAFMKIFEAFLNIYQEKLGNCIDFEDMINRASEYVETGRYRSSYRYILVDEFQDISVGRARLLRALLGQHANARLFSVGDDWQSIFRFAGSDINVMYDYGKYFGGNLGDRENVYSTIALQHNFRSVDKIADASRHFILKNESQMEKEVITLSKSDVPAIRIIYDDRDSDPILQDILGDISSQASGTTSVLIIARYNNLGDYIDDYASIVLFPKIRKFGALRPGLAMSTAQTSGVEWTARSVSVRNSENPSNG